MAEKKKGICHLCLEHGTCDGETPLAPRESCWRFKAHECELCGDDHRERACNPPACLAGLVEEVRS